MMLAQTQGLMEQLLCAHLTPRGLHCLSFSGKFPRPSRNTLSYGLPYQGTPRCVSPAMCAMMRCTVGPSLLGDTCICILPLATRLRLIPYAALPAALSLLEQHVRALHAG